MSDDTLAARLQDLERTNALLQKENERLKERLTQLEAMVYVHTNIGPTKKYETSYEKPAEPKPIPVRQPAPIDLH